MIDTEKVTRLFQREIQNLSPNTIWKNNNGVYNVFGHYCIQPETHGFKVFCHSTEVGVFATTRTALSWCIADKYRAYNTARELLTLDNKLTVLTNDITVRAAVGDRSRNVDLRETIMVKLENKIMQKKQLENELAKYVNWAKYYQQRGFNNETARTGTGQHTKTHRQGT
jgi:hypothetical protein